MFRFDDVDPERPEWACSTVHGEYSFAFQEPANQPVIPRTHDDARPDSTEPACRPEAPCIAQENDWRDRLREGSNSCSHARARLSNESVALAGKSRFLPVGNLRTRQSAVTVLAGPRKPSRRNVQTGKRFFQPDPELIQRGPFSCPSTLPAFTESRRDSETRTAYAARRFRTGGGITAFEVRKERPAKDLEANCIRTFFE